MRKRLMNSLIRTMDQFRLVNGVADYEKVFHSDYHHEEGQPRVKVRIAEATVEEKSEAGEKREQNCDYGTKSDHASAVNRCERT